MRDTMPSVTARDWAIVFARKGKGFIRLEYEAFKLAYPDATVPPWEDIEKELKDIK